MKANANTGATLKAIATFTPPRPTRVVVFQVKVGRGWAKVAVGRESAAGSARFAVPTTVGGKFTYRLSLALSAG